MSQAPVTLLFTDLVNSTELLQQAGDERAQRIFQAHHRLLRRCVAAHDGQEVKWLGDGLMTVFASPADAVRCAVAMQQAARRRAAGERLSIRVGLNVGDTLRDESEYFGTPVVIARRLCDHAAGGQTLCSALVSGLLAGQQAFTFRDCGPLSLKGLAAPVAACELLYQHDQSTALRTHTPFVGRAAELTRLAAKLRDARAGNGGVVMLVGEPGIGKTRTLEELTESGRNAGALVLWGRCYEGEAARPYGPFVEALADYARATAPEVLRADLGFGAAPLARLVPVLRERLPDIPEPVALQPDEERVRLLDAVAQFLIALSVRSPLVLVLDDSHWADAATVALLRHVARFAARHRMLVLGAYRDVEVGPEHPLTDALGTLPRETTYEHIALTGLARTEVEQLLQAVVDQKVPDALVTAITTETSGNPFFIREVLLYLVEEGTLVHREGQWASNLSIERMGIPQGVRQVIQRRLARLSASGNRLLRAAAGFSGRFGFDLAARVAGLEEGDALDEALAAQLLRPANKADTLDFTHALVRHTVYAELSPPRQVRLHRQIAEVMEQAYGADAERYAGEIAWQYYQSAALPGAERGVAYCLAAAERAERAAALEEVADALAIALALLPADDVRRGRLLARRGLALGSTKRAREAAAIALEAAELVAVSDGRAAAADYLAEVAGTILPAGRVQAAWAVARRGLTFAEGRRDWTWAVLRAHDLDRLDAEDPDHPGIVVDTPERLEIAQFSPAIDRNQGLAHGSRPRLWLGHWGVFESRRAALETAGPIGVWAQINWAGAYRDALPLMERGADAWLELGELARALWDVTGCALLRATLGDLASAERDLARLAELAQRAGNPPSVAVMRGIVLVGNFYYRGTALDVGASIADAALARDDRALHWNRAQDYAYCAVLFTFAGRDDDALRAVARAMPAVERAGGGVLNYTALICRCCEALWRLGRADFADVLERNLLAKTLAGDFRCPGADARLAMAQLCALTGRPDEAHQWFERARAVLDEQGARPLRALVDLDEAWMEVRRGPHGDRDRVRALLDVACEQFHGIGMPGWIKRAEALRAQCATQPSDPSSEPVVTRDVDRTASLPSETTVAQLHHEGDYWTLTYSGITGRLKDTKGLHYLAHLLKHPGQEFHALDLVQGAGHRAQKTPKRGAPDWKFSMRRRKRRTSAALSSYAKSWKKPSASTTKEVQRARARKWKRSPSSLPPRWVSAVAIAKRHPPPNAPARRSRSASRRRSRRSASAPISRRSPRAPRQDGRLLRVRTSPTRPTQSCGICKAADAVLRCAGDYWALARDGRAARCRQPISAASPAPMRSVRSAQQ